MSELSKNQEVQAPAIGTIEGKPTRGDACRHPQGVPHGT